jgi:hypothetical protein
MSNALTIPGAVALPENKVWHNRVEIKSESSDRIYIVAQRKTDNTWGCNCPGWIRFRRCKHLEAMKPALEAAGLDVKSINSPSTHHESPKPSKSPEIKRIPKFEF